MCPGTVEFAIPCMSKSNHTYPFFDSARFLGAMEPLHEAVVTILAGKKRW